MEVMNKQTFTYSEADEICLDYYLGEHSETKEQWAQRVFENCQRAAEGLKTDSKGNKLASVYYNRSAESLWEEKKRRRRSALVKEKFGCKCDPSLLDVKNIDQGLKDKLACCWPETHSDLEVLKVRDDPKHCYCTATERHREETAKRAAKLDATEAERKQKVDTLKAAGLDVEVIRIMYPQGEKYI